MTMLAVLVAAVTLSLLTFETPALAASADNIQSGTHTKNPYDTRRSARLKQHRNRRGY